jgi:ABC-type phosphate/phosphonate transport system substrate-binding protein
MTKPLVVGAVVYDPKVTIIWGIIADFFADRGYPIDMVFFSTYDLQVQALMDREIDVAWNSPLAWVDCQRRSSDRCRAIAMRDTDRDRVSHFVVKKEGGIEVLEGLRGKTVAVGAEDSPQATLIPLGLLARHGLHPGNDFQVRHFNLVVGKHGDHVGGELEAFQCLERGDADASAMLDLNWDRWTSDGTISPSDYKVLATTDKFDHCVFTVREDFPNDLEEEWLKVLYSMSYDDPKHREMMDMEGLKEWLPGRTIGFGQLGFAVEQLSFFERK